MASFSPAPMIAASIVVSNINAKHGGGGGGGGKPPPNDDLFPKWLCYFLAIGIAVIVAFLIISVAFTEAGVSYVVNGALVGYEVKPSGKTKKVFVNILQSDGKIRQYNTDTKPAECQYHVIGIGIQVIVTPYHNSIFNDTHYRSHLAVDPCSK